MPDHPEWPRITTSQIKEVNEPSVEEEKIWEEYEKEMKEYDPKK